MLDPAVLRARLADVRDRIARAAARAGRDPSHIKLIAVSKTFPADAVRAAAEFETYLKLAPDGPNSATAKSLVAQLKK